MFLKEEVERLEEIYAFNKKYNLTPHNNAQLATMLGISRQSIWLAINTNKVKEAETRIKEFLQQPLSKGETIVKIYPKKAELLKDYAFTQSKDGTYQTPLIEYADGKQSFKICYIVDNNLELKLYVTNAYSKGKIVDRSVDCLGLVATLLSLKIAYITKESDISGISNN